MLDILSSLECLTFSAPLPLPEGLAVVPPGGGDVEEQEYESGDGQCVSQHGDQGPGVHCQPWSDTRYLISGVMFARLKHIQTHIYTVHRLSTVSVDT